MKLEYLKMKPGIEAVFVHLGNKVPKYLILNIERFTKLFPEIQVTLILDHHLPKLDLPLSLNTWIYESNPTLDLLDGGRDISYRSGFWRFSLERFFALSKYHSEKIGVKLVHIESDVLLLPNFPWDKIENLEDPAWNPYNDNLDVAGVVYLPTWQATNHLSDMILAVIKSNNSITDMQALNQISKTQNPTNRYLPFNPDHYPSNQHGFDGIFDGACIGVWLTGQDPRNNFGSTIIHDIGLVERDHTVIDPSRFRYRVTPAGDLLVQGELGAEVPIFNLHIHSKNENLFSDNWEQELERFVNLSECKKIISEFNFKVFLELFAEVRSPAALAKLVFTQKQMYKLLIYFKTKSPRIYGILTRYI